MHQTTVRFSEELWSTLEREAAVSGVSIAQYVRDAALARVAYVSGQRSRDGAGDAMGWADPRAFEAAAQGNDRIDDSSAVQAQAQLAQARAATLRARAARIRGRGRDADGSSAQ